MFQKVLSFLFLFLWASFLVVGTQGTALAAEWKTNIEEAQKEAKAQKKLILVDFTGSDWCIWCIRLKKEVFSTEKFKAQAPKDFVLVELDFPRSKPQSPEQKQYNRKMARKYRIRGYPTILILNAEGIVLAKTGYQRGGVDNYLKHLGELKKLEETYQTLKKTGEKKDIPLEKLVKAFKTLMEMSSFEQISRKQKSLIKKAVDRLASQDKDGKYKNIIIALKDIPNALKPIEGKKTRPSEEEFLQVAKNLEALLAKKPTGLTLQQIDWYLGLIYYRFLNDKAKGLDYLQKAHDAAPNSNLGKRIQNVLRRLKR